MNTAIYHVSDLGAIRGDLVIDMSQFPVELVASRQEQIRLSQWKPAELRHPDLWHNGRWIEPR